MGKTALLTFGLVASLAIAGMESTADFRHKLSGDKKILHALDRLTYGPRPGDAEAVKRMGLKKWIAGQLHPERVAENPVLEVRLKPLDTLDMDTERLLMKYPPPQVIAAVARGDARLFGLSPEDRARLERMAERYKDRGKEKKQQPNLEALRRLLTREEAQTLRRGTPEERYALLEKMPANRLDQLLDAMPDGMRRQAFAFAPVEVRRRMLASFAPVQVIAQDLSEAKLYRAIYSNRQLQEVLVDFWFNHFNVFLDKGADRHLITAYEREAIRPHVLGKFSDLLRATAESPAMLWYLDNWQSMDPHAAGRPGRRSRGLNENYARELLELHTLGVDGGYTQHDIVEVARCFTGWTIDDPRRGAKFRFNERMHDPGEKTVLGVKIAAGGGKEDGMKVLEILASHPSTARFISTKLAQRFVADNPPEPLIARMTATFRKTQGDIRAVMQTMIDAPEFFTVGAYRSKVKSPLEMVASAARATNADVTFAFGLANQVAQMGQPLYRKLEPTGYPNTGEDWASSASLLARMNFAVALANNKLPGVKVETTGERSELAKTIGSPEFQRR